MYCQFSGQTMEDLKKQLKPMAKNGVDAKLVIDQIVKEENIVPTAEDIQAEIKKYADQYGLEPEKIAQYYENDPGFIQEVAIQKALELVCSTAAVSYTHLACEEKMSGNTERAYELFAEVVHDYPGTIFAIYANDEMMRLSVNNAKDLSLIHI